MSTQDVPGANPANADILAAGSWAEHADGSLIFVKGNEGGQTIYEIYDVAQDPPVYYQDAMLEAAFKKQFSFPPVGTSPDKWTWHDKTAFPWSRVMKNISKPVPMPVSADVQLSAAQRVANSLHLRARNLDPSALDANVDQDVRKGRAILDRLQKAYDAFVEG